MCHAQEEFPYPRTHTVAPTLPKKTEVHRKISLKPRHLSGNGRFYSSASSRRRDYSISESFTTPPFPQKRQRAERADGITTANRPRRIAVLRAGLVQSVPSGDFAGNRSGHAMATGEASASHPIPHSRRRSFAGGAIADAGSFESRNPGITRPARPAARSESQTVNHWIAGFQGYVFFRAGIFLQRHPNYRVMGFLSRGSVTRRITNKEKANNESD